MNGKTPSHEDVTEALKFLSSSNELGEIAKNKIAGKYAVLRILGCAGQATVALAHDPKLNRKVVLKIYHQGISKQEKTRILNEGRALARIQSPYVVNCFGVEELESTSVLVLDHVDGETLETYLANKNLDSQGKVKLFRQLILGVQAVHESGLLHLDLKPNNIVVDGDGNLKLIDFGLVQMSDSSGSDLGGSGTPAFMPPEVANSESGKIGEKTDVYGLGAVFYFLLTGRPLFDGESAEKCRQQAKANQFVPASDDPTIERPLAKICDKCLKTSPDDRFASTDCLLKEVDGLFQEKSGVGWVPLLVGLVAIAIAGVIGWQTYFSPPAAPRPIVESSKSNPAQGFLPVYRELDKCNKKVWDSIANGQFANALEQQKRALELSEHPGLIVAFKKDCQLRVFELEKLVNSQEKVKPSTQKAFASLQRVNQLLDERGIKPDSISDEQFKNAQSGGEIFDQVFPKESVFRLLKDVILFRARYSQDVSFDKLESSIALVERSESLLGPLAAITLDNRLRVASIFREHAQPLRSEKVLQQVYRDGIQSKGYCKFMAAEAQLTRAVVISTSNPYLALNLATETEKIHAEIELERTPDTLARLAAVYLDIQRPQKCVELGEEALVHKNFDEVNRMILLSKLSQAYGMQVQEKMRDGIDVSHLKEKGSRCVELCELRYQKVFESLHSNRAEIEQRLSLAQHFLGNNNSALEYATKSRDGFEKIASDSDYWINMQSQVVWLAIECGESELALTNAERLWAKEKLIKTPNARRLSLFNIAWAFFEAKENDRASKIVEEAKVFAKEQIVIEPDNKNLWVDELKYLDELKSKY